MSIRRVAARVIMSAITAAGVISIVGTAQAFAVTAGDGSIRKTRATPEVGSVDPLGPLTELVIQRLLISDQVAASKFGTGKSIDDPVREQQELASIRQSAMSLGIDPVATVGFFRQQIAASKVVQQGLFDRWTAHPDQAPTTRPELTALRDQLDQLTTELLQQLVAQRHVLSSGLERRVDPDVATVSGVVFNHLDALHRHALNVAIAPTCTA